MTDAHCHIRRGETRHFLCDPTGDMAGPDDVVFHGYHPWCFLGSDRVGLGSSRVGLGSSRGELGSSRGELETLNDPKLSLTAPNLTLNDPKLPLIALKSRLAADPRAGVGEIGLDRLKERNISPAMREAFEAQLAIAAEFRRPVVLHGAKCWGEVAKAAQVHAGRIPAFLFHGFSRSGGLIPQIVAMNGFISVGPALLNDHAVNYRELVKEIPSDRLLVESDATAENASETPSVAEIAAKLAELRGLTQDELETMLESNATAFAGR